MKAWSVKPATIGWLSVGYLLFLFGCLLVTWPGLIAKNKAQQADTVVALALDAESLDALNDWSIIPNVPCTHIAMDSTATPSQEARARALSQHILWNVGDNVNAAEFVPRVQSGDFVYLTENALDHPLIYLNLPSHLTDGGVCASEFDPNRVMPAWAARYALPVVKTHVIGIREMLTAQPSLWRARLVRAVSERWIRCLIVHVSPALSKEENARFINETAHSLEASGFMVGNHAQRLAWSIAPLSTRVRWMLVLILSIATPLLCLYWVRQWRANALWMFAAVSGMSIGTGVVIHALGATPVFVLGLEPLRGLKLQLCGALLLAIPMLFSGSEFKARFDWRWPSRKFLFWTLTVAAIIALYWMRSGNNPQVPVSDMERQFRDGLERWFVVRPRFKEFLFGHPLFLLGLLLTRRPVVGRWWGDGRVFLWLGLLAQISILNTFTHFQTPFSHCIIRTLHGLWLGLALAIAGRSVLQLYK